MKKKNTFCSFVVIAGLLGLMGCGKDISPDAFKAQKKRIDQGQTDQVAGTYSGILSAARGSQPMGALSIELHSDTQMDNGEQLNTVSAQLTLIDGTSEKTIRVSDGHYNLVDGNFRIETVVAHSATSTVTLALAGTIRGNLMVGKLEAVGFPAYGGSFELTKNGEIPEVNPPQRTVDRGPGTKILTYAGKATNDRAEVMTTKFTYIPALRNSDQKFLDRFYPIRSGNLSVSFENDIITILFPNALWDIRTGTLSAVSTSDQNGRTDFSASLNCIATTEVKTPGWQCDWTGKRRMTLELQRM